MASWFSFSSLFSIGEYKAKIKCRPTSTLRCLHLDSVAQRANGKDQVFLGRRVTYARAEALSISNPRYDGGRFTLSPKERPPLLFLPCGLLTGNSFKQWLLRVALAGIGQHHDDSLPLHFWLLATRSAAATAAPSKYRENSFFARQPPAVVPSILRS